MFKKLVKAALPLLVIVVAMLIAKGMIGSREQLEAGGEDPPLPLVQTIAVELGEVATLLASNGNVAANIELDVSSEVTGRVVWATPEFEPGERVSAGTVLLRIDAVNYELALAEAEAALAGANTALADAQALRKRAAVTEAKLNIKAVEQRIAKAKQDLSYTQVRAPFDAIIDRKLVEVGQFVAIGQALARLLSTDAAHISLPFTAAQASLLGEPENTEVVLSVGQGEQQRQWPAKMLRVESRVDQVTRVVPVVVEVAAPYDLSVHKHSLPLGLFVQASVTGRPIGGAVRLPNSVLHGESVYVLRKGELQRKEVTVAYREGSAVVVSDGLQDGDQVVQTRLEVMFDGLKVQAVDSDA